MVFVRLCGDHRVQSPVEVRHPGVRCVAAGVGRPGYKRGDGVIEQDQRRYKHLITGLTNGAEYTVRVLAYNTNGDVTASAEAMATARGTTALPNMWLSPTASDPVAAVRSEATYSVTFQGAWTTTVTSSGVPSGAHFTTLIGGVHNAGVTFLREGGMASARGSSSWRNSVERPHWRPKSEQPSRMPSAFFRAAAAVSARPALLQSIRSRSPPTIPGSPCSRWWRRARTGSWASSDCPCSMRRETGCRRAR